MKVKRKDFEAFSDLVDTVMDTASAGIAAAQEKLKELDAVTAKGLMLLETLESVLESFVEDETTKEADAPVSNPEAGITREDKVTVVSNYNGYDPVLTRQFSDEALDAMYARAIGMQREAARFTWKDYTDQTRTHYGRGDF